jgi:hypothetical protein
MRSVRDRLSREAKRGRVREGVSVLRLWRRPGYDNRTGVPHNPVAKRAITTMIATCIAP